MNTKSHNKKVRRNYKDSLFKMLFGENKENALSLYNAVNDSSYTDVENLEYTTLTDVIYMKMKNDVSFLFGTSMNLYEHQSTYNPNMPLRGLLYFSDLYRGMIEDNEKIYSQKVVRIPNPKFIVFYNGSTSDMEENIRKLKLSDCFETTDDTGEFEWTATMININHGYNTTLFERCRTLREYSIFIQMIRDYNSRGMELEDAIEKAIDKCIEQNILKEVLESQKREVKNMVLTEFNEEKYEKMVREESSLSTIISLFKKNKLSLEDALEETELSEQEFFQAIADFGY